MAKKIKKILIANRGEIAVRVIRACRDLGIKSVVVFSEADRAAYHVRMADEAYFIGPAQSSQSYLVHDKIIDVAKRSKADAIHPGYGFLSENAEFSDRCAKEGIIFIGPTGKSIALLGDKISAREMAIKQKLPIVPGAEIGSLDSKAIKAKAREIGYPVLIKAAAGGGGKGMRVVRSEEMLEESLMLASNEAKSSFGDARVFIEKYLERPRHVEIQILLDMHGNGIHLGERECSIQRRHQKVIEESPSPIMTPELRERMGNAAVTIAKASGYYGAGTCEFMIDQDLSFYFLEVNTRLQVEHPVTEMVTGLDLVKEQIAIAEGEVLPYKQSDIELNGHAIECRIYAEDPEQGFMPSTGKLQHYRIPAGPGVRVDAGVVIYNEIPIYYDPMIAKLIVWGHNRPEAIARTKRALEEFRVSGLKTTISFHRTIMDNEKFVSGDLSTRFLEEEYPNNKYYHIDEETTEAAALAVALDKFVKERRLRLDLKEGGAREISNWARAHRRTAMNPQGDDK